jgi:hypothetical protein
MTAAYVLMVGFVALEWYVYFYDQYAYRVVYDVRSKLDAKFSNFKKGKEWEWKLARLEW